MSYTRRRKEWRTLENRARFAGPSDFAVKGPQSELREFFEDEPRELWARIAWRDNRECQLAFKTAELESRPRPARLPGADGHQRVRAGQELARGGLEVHPGTIEHE